MIECLLGVELAATNVAMDFASRSEADGSGLIPVVGDHVLLVGPLEAVHMFPQLAGYKGSDIDDRASKKSMVYSVGVFF